MSQTRQAQTDIVIACVRDEVDLVSAFVDFYLDQGFDRVCLVDNGSRDGTFEVVRDHPAWEQITLVRDSRAGYDARLDEYYHRFLPAVSRWVFFVDVDEFVWLPGGIKSYAATLPPDVNVLTLGTAEMLPSVDRELGVSSLTSVRRDHEHWPQTKVVWKAGVPRKIFAGKHAITGDVVVPWSDPRVFIRHFHTRSESQFQRKLQNRLDTATAISAIPDLEDDVYVATRAAREDWLRETRQLLGPGGWAAECARIATRPWVEDSTIRDWFLSRQE